MKIRDSITAVDFPEASQLVFVRKNKIILSRNCFRRSRLAIYNKCTSVIGWRRWKAEETEEGELRTLLIVLSLALSKDDGKAYRNLWKHYSLDLFLLRKR